MVSIQEIDNLQKEIIKLINDPSIGAQCEIHKNQLNLVCNECSAISAEFAQKNMQIRNAVAEMEQLKTEISESESKYKMLFDNLMIGFGYHKIICDEFENPIDYTCLTINPAFEKILGLENSDILNKSMLEIRPNMEKFWVETCGKVALSGESIEFEKFCENNEHYYHISVFSPKKYYFAVLYYDITERKKSEQELILAKQNAEVGEKLKSAFLSNISHEIRTPLNGILGFSQLLIRGELTEVKKEKYAQIINQSSEQLLKIINDIVEMSKIHSNQLQLNESVTDVDKIFLDLFYLFSPSFIEKNINFIQSSKLNSNSKITTDESKLSSIFNYLLENSLKFTSQGFVEYGAMLERENIIFFVKDSGIGISVEQKNLIFESFKQADSGIDRKYGGLGLGLTIAKSYIDLLGGEFWFNSEVNKGTSFYFSIPYVPEHIVNQPLQPITLSHNFAGKTVLIAEDEINNFIILEEFLAETDISIIHARNGLEATELAQDYPSIDLILMDIKMPDMNGYEATRQIKLFKPDLPIIAQTAYAFDNYKERIIAYGFDDYITKPIDQNELIQIISQYIKGNG